MMPTGSSQQSNVASSAQQPTRANNPLQVPFPQPNQQLGSLQQPTQQLGSYQQPNQQLGSLQQSTQLGPVQQPSQLGAFPQPRLTSNVFQGSLMQQPSQLGSFQPANKLGSFQPNQQLGSLQQQAGLASKFAPSSMQQLIKGDRSMITLSDDSYMVKQIQETHNPDGREVDARPLLYIVEDILNRATLPAEGIITTGTQAQIENLEDKTHPANLLVMLDALSYTIDRIASEIAYKAFSGMDAHQTTLSIFNMVSPFAWDAKLVLAVAAFALNYGEFWLLAQMYSTNNLAKSMALLRQVPSLIEHAGILKPRLDALNDLLRSIMEVSRCVVEFKELPSMYITQDVPALASAWAHVPTAVYWTIRSIVACAAQISSFASLGYEFVTSGTESWELSTLAHKLKTIRDHLKKQLEICYQYIEEKRDIEDFQTLVNLFEMMHIDNIKPLKALIYPRDDLQPLVDGSSKKRVNIEVLRRKNVLLLISTLDISQDELSILEQIYNESRLHPTRQDIQYEVVWIPIVDRSVQWTDPMQKQFEALQSGMPWYTVYHPSLIGKAVMRFIRERWHFRNKPILVVLDPQGKVVSPNAIHMMWIWGSNAFPFTSLREEALWRDETWRLELLVNGIDQTILNWVKEEKYIFLYGGDDIEWIRKFTNAARAVSVEAKIPMEMVYVGKGSKRDKVRRVIATITLEKLSTSWQDQTMIWFFWTRLESMLFSKIQLGKADDHFDPMVQEIKKLLTYDREGGWAVLSKGSSVVVNGHGNTMLPTLLEYDSWKQNVSLHGFDLAFKNHHDMLRGISHPCSRFEFSHVAGKIPEGMRCPECHRGMEKYTTFLCCHDEGILSILQ
ncbi:protein SIEVE ELEMENT OCCLUSION B-like isoform X3 [Juglans microcarpa x Juglans regia]|uniref:protein SIEVE ELEMENT OCCLUSION B-like isoform X3 n=1 Tax=Juglans microcarpa x Juglans regia TaxID=2249226 RepID=UPI001B7E433D|nr:protein SIEVE ELEMENT OCCLUSION B-like isoform X3 [Juglans microcarpa x Juglans regia]